MKRVEIRLNISAVAPLLDVIKQGADGLKQELAIKSALPENDREFTDTWNQELLAGQNSDIRELLGLFGADFFSDGVVAIDSNNCESLLRACSALRFKILDRWLQGLPDDLLEDEDAPVTTVPEAQRLPFACYTFLDQLQKIMLEHLDPLAPDEPAE